MSLELIDEMCNRILIDWNEETRDFIVKLESKLCEAKAKSARDATFVVYLGAKEEAILKRSGHKVTQNSKILGMEVILVLRHTHINVAPI